MTKQIIKFEVSAKSSNKSDKPAKYKIPYNTNKSTYKVGKPTI